ncbi:exodeoxyribonuclease III [Martelella mediterranea]|uniref:Exodeoxyribonuclease-3 n=1 Tax=Martelella mediterranea TaxID=293089 RepID=A0A4R3NUV2_9HYPH|nr:exodeoxyribonuclease III [Martelella mediterranea]TCT41820.1 exodeoxyribonuclease-3 [Martelella mediterranea]
MELKLSTWNINSVRLRMPIVARFLEEHAPDILCLQEIKCLNDQFPAKPLRELGYEHVAVHGQKGYHGVAIVSRLPLTESFSTDYCTMGDTRHISVVFEAGSKRIRLHNFYVPAGGDEPDPETNPKFRHKLDFLEEMKALKADQGDGVSSILVGDLNIAPEENDVWSHKQLLKIVSHTPVETDGLKAVVSAGRWNDLMRLKTPADEKLYTWWSYRAKDWRAANRGRRLDHIWTSDDLVPAFSHFDILTDARGWEKPSDHVPVTAHFSL